MTFFRAWRQPGWPAVLVLEMKAPNRKLACAVHRLGKMNQALKTQLGSDKKEHFDRLAMEADSAEPAFVWEKLKKLGIGRVFKRTGRNVLPMLEGQDGQSVTTVQEAQQIWRSHAEMLEFGSTVSREEAWQSCVKQQIAAQEGGAEPEFHLIPTYLSLEKACRRVQASKATGPDGIVGELLHAFPEAFARLLHPLTTKIFLQKMEPLSLKGGKLVRAWKGRGSS